MDQRTNSILFALLRSAIRGTQLSEEDLKQYSPELMGELLRISSKHDVAHLLAWGLKQNGLITKENADVENFTFKAVFRHERIKYEYDNLCAALEKAGIAFLPLKGSVLRDYYPEPWMRTSCDIDVLVHKEDLESAISYLSDTLNFVEKERATHDVSLFSPTGVHIELHFDLVEEGRANNAIDVLSAVWDNAFLSEGSKYRYEMDDAFFYFYHIAHMAKHFENGGCGIRPFIDLWILDRMENADKSKRDELLERGSLDTFAKVARKLSEVWLDGSEADDLSWQMQSFLLHGGVYGSADNRVMLGQSKKGGRAGYLLSRIFIPYDKLKRYYPILEKHRWLMPFMQVRRWFMIFKPDVARMARNEMQANVTSDKEKSAKTERFLTEIGL